MAQQTINNGESGLVIRGKLNDMFSELYSDPIEYNVIAADITNGYITVVGLEISIRTKIIRSGGFQSKQTYSINTPSIGKISFVDLELGELIIIFN